ncbi:transglutaminase-like cysteine peptidase [Guyparkeria halophila]|uniref:Transglutaminase-like cysteine peptidase n=1 Tax=Guyparkeria halophila TaxID=47960 RepID=A0ABZ0Z1E1_9GAMM|nr:transglutaminase-like cysteine peptidase [Guyparkeria halophila]WQH17231.1 transglutaminase-like cysteine peptidase [Guyparkeria halophila]
MPASGTIRLVAAAIALLLAASMHGFGLAEVRVDFGTLKAEVEDRFGPDRLPVVDGLEELLDEISHFAPNERVERVNAFFNRQIRYVEDTQLWGQSDYWASPVETIGHGAGDCEDFAIAKYLVLLEAGIDNRQLRLIYVRARMGGGSRAHMVLGYYPEPQAEPLILDSLVRLVAPASRRPDLTPVFSFNSEGLWVGGQERQADRATDRLSRWRDVLERTQAEGIRLPAPTASSDTSTRQNE